MALTRKQLSALGIEAEKIDQIIEAHTETVSGLKDQISQLKDELTTAKEDAGKLPDVQKELDDLKAANEADAKAREGKDYDALKKEYDDYKAEQAAKETRRTKETALRGLLKDLNMSEKGVKMVMKYHDVDSVEVDDSGALTDAAGLKKSIGEDWGDYIVKEEIKGADTKTPPGESGGKTYKDKEEIMSIKDRAERQKAIAENPELFGIEA